jgi:hypothetical protein
VRYLWRSGAQGGRAKAGDGSKRVDTRKVHTAGKELGVGAQVRSLGVGGSGQGTGRQQRLQAARGGVCRRLGSLMHGVVVRR